MMSWHALLSLGCPAAAALLAAAIGEIALPAAWAVVIDRVAVSIGDTSAITVSEIDLALRVTAFINGETPDFRPESKRQAANRLIEQSMVRTELELSHYPLPPESEGARMVQDLIVSRFHNDRALFAKELAKYGITEEDLKRYFLWQATFLRFIDVRFRPGVQVTDEEVRDYFEKVVKPLAAKANPGKPVTLDEYRDRIESTLTARRVDQELNQWLDRARRRMRVQFREEAFR